MFNNILVASDGSKCGDKAVDLAIDLASKYGAKISALYVMDFSLAFSYDDLDDADVGGFVVDSDDTLESIYEGNLINKAVFDVKELKDLIEMINKKKIETKKIEEIMLEENI